MGGTPKPYTEDTDYSKGRHTETLPWGRRNFERGTHRNLTLGTSKLLTGDTPKPYTEDTDYSKGRHTETLHWERRNFERGTHRTLHWRHRLFERETRRNLTLQTPTHQNRENTETLHWGHRNFELRTRRKLTLQKPTIRKGDIPKPYTGDTETSNGEHTESLHCRHRQFKRGTRRNLTLGTSKLWTGNTPRPSIGDKQTSKGGPIRRANNKEDLIPRLRICLVWDRAQFERPPLPWTVRLPSVGTRTTDRKPLSCQSLLPSSSAYCSCTGRCSVHQEKQLPTNSWPSDVHMSVNGKYISKVQPTRSNVLSIYLFL